MQSARPSKRVNRGCVPVAAGIMALVILFYLLLSAGKLEGVIRAVVHRATAGQDVVVSVYGGSSDLFTSTGVDSVIVTNDRGLRVAVYGITVKGSVYGYLFGNVVDRILVDSLIIVTPGPSDEPPDSSLSPIFTGTMAGMVTRAQTVRLSYGRIVDQNLSVLVDSMYLESSIPDIDSITVEVHTADSYIPLFGMVTASGVLCVDSFRTTLNEFKLVTPPGDFNIQGFLNSDSTFNFAVDGSVSTAFIPELPLGSADISGNLTGSTSEPQAFLTLSRGCVIYQGLPVGFTADTVFACLSHCSVSGFTVRVGGVAVRISGTLSYDDLLWDGNLSSNLQNTDLSSFFSVLPETRITGTLDCNGSGAGSSLNELNLGCSLTNSAVGNYSVQYLNLSCSGNQSNLHGNISAGIGGGTVTSAFLVSLGLNMIPVAWQADLTAQIPDCGILAAFTDSSLAGARGFRAGISGQGNRTAFTLTGTAGLSSFSNSLMSLERASFNGSVTGGSSGTSLAGNLLLGGFNTADVHLENGSFNGSVSSGTSGIRARGDLGLDLFTMMDSSGTGASGIEAFLDVNAEDGQYLASCSLSVAEASYSGITADSLLFFGNVNYQNGGISGFGSLSSYSILAGGTVYSLRTSILAEPGFVRIDSMRVGAPGDLNLCLSGLLSYEPEGFGFSLDGIVLTRAEKLRLISSGDIEISSDSSGIQLDTLWFDLPSGEIAASGWLSADSMQASAGLRNVDIASFTAMLGLSVPVSGILETGVSVSGRLGDLHTELTMNIDHPTYDQWDQSDSLTLDLSSYSDSLIVHGLWSWTDGIRSGIRLGLDGIWNENDQLEITPPDVMWLEAELTGVGDELFYLLPMPLKTYGASVSARIEYQRDTAEFSAGIASRFDRLYLSNPGIEFPGVALYLTYPDPQEDGAYNGTLTMTSGQGQEPTLQSTLLLNVKENFFFESGELPLRLDGYSFRAVFNKWETLIAGIGWIQLSGSLFSSSENLQERPRLTGKINIDQATISMGGGGTIEGTSGGASSRPAELPLDMSIRITGERGIWFRTSYANVELSTDIDITTLNGLLSIGGDVRAVRGSVYLLGREFHITQGEVRILQTTPIGIELDIQAETRIRSSISGAEYTITVSVTGDPEQPELALSATGPDGSLSEEDIVTLLTAGMTYGELQQFDGTALGSVAGNYLGQWLARSIREDVGLDALQFTPDFSSDTTSLVVNAGKYVLPDLFVSYSSDVFSSDAGTMRAQYFFNRDFFLEGSTKSTLTGSHDPSLELHYTFRY